jgi:hypothetical protein
MKYRATLTLAAAAGLAAPALAQDVMQVTYSWSETIAGTITPVPNPNSILDPGEGARINLAITALHNGVNTIGQTTTYTPPPPPGTGTIRGIASFIYNLIGDNNAVTAQGWWSNRAITPLLPTGAFTGNVLNNGSQLDSFGGGQFVAPGETADATNPIQDAFRGVWTPAAYSIRTVNFKANSPFSPPEGYPSGILVQYGSAFLDPTDPTTEYALYLTRQIPSNFGLGVNIPIAPAPTNAWAAACALAAASRRRRR